MATIVGSSLVLLPSIVFAQQCPSTGIVVTANTSLSKNYYNCHGDGVIIEASGILFNCNGNTVQGSVGNKADGIYAFKVTGVTIENCNLRRFGTGIVLNSSSGNYLINDNAVIDYGNGFAIVNNSNGNTVTGDSAISDGASGYFVSGSSGNNVYGNLARGAVADGFLLSDATGNSLEGNTATRNTLDGYSLTTGSTGNNLVGNTARANGYDGFAADSTSTGNHLIGNEAATNDNFGYSDASTSLNAGYPDYGTGNYYVGDGYNHNFAASSPACAPVSATCKLTQPGYM